LWDENKRKKIVTKCILLGSSSLNLQKGLSESLTGRFEMTRAWHWSLPQSFEGYKLDLEDYLLYGGYPGSYPLIKNHERWKNYLTESIIETVIGKDILTQTQVKSPALFKQAFHLVSSYPAQEISYNKLLVSRPTSFFISKFFSGIFSCERPVNRNSFSIGNLIPGLSPLI
jgi:uncharacterized protein